ncbi:serine hydrolase domain-containing protein [Changchengzhania lutea]|uniref:serine hydrolase domain-containing protein n=1 Tax=Changchengzhania lutea TaxID=2049305 RepID=UPI00115EF5C9|nr:serine hydrolase domain-containing protein [Changchengzhania lutea]
MYKKTCLILFILTVTFSCKKSDTDRFSPKNFDGDILAIENGLLPAMVLKGEKILHFSLTEQMELHKVPGVSIAVVDNGELVVAKGYGMANTTTKTEVDVNTLFQAASISKLITALAVLKLMEDGHVNLDTDVNTYLKSWKVPENKFTTNQKVTLRRLLTHSAGVTVHGFPGYKRTDAFPSTLEVLNGEGNTDKIKVDTIPGMIARYSGGGYTIIQQVIEDISETKFEDYMEANILTPLGMTNSTFKQPLPKGLFDQASAAYDDEGNILDGYWHNYPEKAAAGLWTTPIDLAKYTVAIQDIMQGDEDGLLQPETVKQMLSKGKFQHGLGPGIAKEADSLIFKHGGKNAGFTNRLVAFANKGQALIIMTNGDNGGRLLSDIERAVSKHFNWNLNKTKVIDPVPLSQEYLERLTGTYKYIKPVERVGGDYIVKARIEHNNLAVFDIPDNEDFHFVATDSLKFIDIEKNEHINFKKADSTYTLWWDNQFEFKKIEDN